MTPLVIPIVFLTYDKPTLSKAGLQHLRELGASKVIVVHNGSFEKNATALMGDFPEFEHLILEKNLGFSGGANAGLKMALDEFPWALFMSNDTWLESWPNANDLKTPGIVAPTIWKRQTNKIDSMGAWFYPGRAKLVHRRGEPNSVLPEGEPKSGHRRDSDFHIGLRHKPRAHFYIPGAAFLIHRDVFTSTSGFDESLGTYWEDVDLSLRAQKAGYELRVSLDWNVRHKIGKTCHGDPLYSLYFYQRNRRKLSWRHSRLYEKPRLVATLGSDWLKLAWKLARQGRQNDVTYLARAILELPPHRKT